MLSVTETIAIPDDDVEFTYARSGGPGGQNVNKVASKALLRWRMGQTACLSDAVKARLRAMFPSRCTVEGDVLFVSQRYRDQERNREDCMRKLAEVVRAALRTPTPRKATKPSGGAKRRRLEDKKRQSVKKQSRKSGGGADD